MQQQQRLDAAAGADDTDEEVQLFAQPRRKRKPASQTDAGDRKRRSGAALDAAEAADANAHQQRQPAQQQQQQQRRRDTQQQQAAAHDTSEQQQQQQQNEEAEVTFRSLGVSDWLCSVLTSLGIRQPTQVQASCIPAVLAGRNVIGAAQTGSGKTAAFALPILQQLAADPFGVFALVLTPTRELAMQLADQFRAFGTGMSLRVATIIGGMEQQAQARTISRRPHVVVATPGRLAALLEADSSLAAGFSRLRHLVLDEADRLLEPSFEADLRCLLAALPPPADRQTLLFSATLTAPLAALQAASLEDAHVFQAYEGLRTADRLAEQYTFIPHKVKDVYLAHLLANTVQALREQQQQPPAAGGGGGNGEAAAGGGSSEGGVALPPGLAARPGGVRSAIVFVSSCKGCRLLDQVLRELGLPAASLHSGKSQKQRLAALHAFKAERVPLLLATDVASRGLDIPVVDLVVNYDLPRVAADYVHRVGRTARAGRPGWSLSFVTQYDVELVAGIEGHIGHKLDECVMDEAAVLRGLGRVYAAKRAAALALLAAEDREAVGTSGRPQCAKK